MAVIRDELARAEQPDGAGSTASAHPLVCPETKLPLQEVPIEQAERRLSRGQPLLPRAGEGPAPVGRTPTVLVRDDGGCAYPVLEGIPVLLGPERLVPPANGRWKVDLTLPQYAEAYEEMDFYSSEAVRAEERLDSEPELRRLRRAVDLSEEEKREFPSPGELWLDATYEATAQWQAFRHIGPLQGKRVLQIGGKGLHAVTFLLAGASEAWLVSPMVSELRFALELARETGMAGRLHVVAGVAEELPLADGHFDAIYTISLHHMVTTMALPECRRALRPGGKLAASEPWRAPLYRIGTTLLGKREPEVHCRPLTKPRMQPLFECFPDGQVTLHGTLLRYPMLALLKAGLTLSLPTAWRVARIDDAVSSLVPGLARWGSCATVLGIAPD